MAASGGTKPAGTSEPARATKAVRVGSPLLASQAPTTNVNALCYVPAETHGSEYVDICWGFDYNPANNHLRGYAEMSASNGRIHVRAEPLNLGDRNGVLKSKRGNSQTGYLFLETDFVGCHYPNGVYISNLHYSIRWSDGSLTSGHETGQYLDYATNICI
jgi:hypothetical protein